MKRLLSVCFGEFLGVFIPVFFGISTVAAAAFYRLAVVPLMRTRATQLECSCEPPQVRLAEIAVVNPEATGSAVK